MRARAEVSKEPNEFPPATCRDLSENGDTNQGLNIIVAKETLNEGFTDVKLADRAFYDPKETVILFLIFIFLHGPLPTKKNPTPVLLPSTVSPDFISVCEGRR